MARIHELLRQLRSSSPANAAFADDIEHEVDALRDRRAFGLNFERHTPEEVELPGRAVRVGDKVHILPCRGELPTAANSRLWRVTALEGKGDDRVATLEAYPVVDPAEAASAAVADLVVVAEFRDPIYPGLSSTGKVERGGDKPHHTVINAENYHALQALLFTHRGKVDCIYIDPPYNTRDKDWKYNNDYVNADDLYRHSKWLAFMERRLLLAKELLNPDDSVLIVTIDEREYLRLGLLLEQTFPEAAIQMISTVINPKGVSRGAGFRRADEYIFFAMFGCSSPARLPLGAEWSASSRSEPVGQSASDEQDPISIKPGWTSMMRRGSNSSRADRPLMFYPIYADPVGPRIAAIGEPLPTGVHEAPSKKGLVAILPIRTNGSEGRWQVSCTELAARIEQGRVRLGRTTAYGYVVNYLPDGAYADVLSDRFEIVGRAEDGSLIAHGVALEEGRVAPTQWKIASHNASEYGSTMLNQFVPQRRFPFPKSLYAVEDALRFFVKNKPNALVLDYFCGSGTTAHAVMRLNKQDGGCRRAIVITNNEVGADEQSALRRKGLRPGDPAWERWGICEYITKPRIEAAITGVTPDGQPIKGDYKFIDEFHMEDGFEENVEFFTLTYEAPLRLRANRDFEKVASLLWLRAGSHGRRIDSIPNGWAVTDAYGVLSDLDQTDAFVEALNSSPSATVAFIITDDDSLFEAVAHALPVDIEPIRMYDTYLRNFEIDAMRGVR